MPYQIGGHKPKAPPKEFRVPLRQRLAFAAIGLVCIFVGIYRQANGAIFGRNWFNQPLYPLTFMAVGVPVFVLALVPTAWLEKIAKRLVS
jgi:uncharacterized membrane protein